MKRKVSGVTKHNRMGYLFVLPFVIAFLIFSVYPVGRTLYLSFTNYKGFGKPTFVAFDNYIRVFTDKYFWRALGNTLKIWGVNIVLQLGTAFILIIIYSDRYLKIKGLKYSRVIYYLPNLMAGTSVAFLFGTLLDWRFGTINQFLSSLFNSFGSSYNPINWLGDPKYAGLTISVISTWMWFGNSFLMLMAGVQSIPQEFFEAAMIDGAGRWRTFKDITMPSIRPIFFYVSITSFIGGLQMFDLPYLLYSGQKSNAAYSSIETVVMYMYKYGFEAGTQQVGYAAAISYALFFIIAFFSIFQLRAMLKKEVN